MAMTEALGHRGPDDEGFWSNPKAHLGLGHRRLAIIDPAGGKQPMLNEDGRIVTIFNGVIYNYRELREDLIASGHCFTTKSDTEVIVHLYEEFGVEFVDKLRGMFAIAVWDDREQQLVLIRDRVGKKPLYYLQADNQFVFASEIKAIVAAKAEGLTLDPLALADYLSWGSVPAPSTIYREVRAVRPGHLLVVRDRRIAEERRYWRQRMGPKTAVSPAEAVEQVDALFQESVRLRLRSDVPVAAFLSGGIDSGIVTAMASQRYPGRLTTITIGFEEQAFDERPLARLVAERYGTDHHDVVIRPRVVEDLPRIVRAYDQPFADSSCIPSFYVARAAREFTKVVLNGDGGDELFAGYRRYLAARLNGLFCWADGTLAAPLWRVLSRVLPVPRGFRTGYAFAHRWIRGMGLEPTARYMAWAALGMSGENLNALLKRSGFPGKGFDSPTAEAMRHLGSVSVPPALADFGGCGRVDQMLAADFGTILPNDLLVKMDIATMAHGLEARSPLLDQVLVEVVSAYPESTKLRGLRTKPILRDLAGRYLPPAVWDAPKRGFEVPLIRWLRVELRDMSRDVILSRNGLLAELFDRAAVERLLMGDGSLEPARWSRHVWLLLMLGMWDRERRAAISGPREDCAG